MLGICVVVDVEMAYDSPHSGEIYTLLDYGCIYRLAICLLRNIPARKISLRRSKENPPSPLELDIPRQRWAELGPGVTKFYSLRIWRLANPDLRRVLPEIGYASRLLLLPARNSTKSGHLMIAVSLRGGRFFDVYAVYVGCASCVRARLAVTRDTCCVAAVAYLRYQICWRSGIAKKARKRQPNFRYMGN